MWKIDETKESTVREYAPAILWVIVLIIVLSLQGDDMWPYNECEWNTMTYGVAGAQRKYQRAYELEKMRIAMENMSKKYILIDKEVLLLVVAAVVPKILLLLGLLWVYLK